MWGSRSPHPHPEQAAAVFCFSVDRHNGSVRLFPLASAAAAAAADDDDDDDAADDDASPSKT